MSIRADIETVLAAKLAELALLDIGHTNDSRLHIVDLSSRVPPWIMVEYGGLAPSDESLRQKQVNVTCAVRTRRYDPEAFGDAVRAILEDGGYYVTAISAGDFLTLADADKAAYFSAAILTVEGT